MVNLGVGVTCGGDTWDPELIRAVEDLGFDSFWTGEHIVYHRPILDAVPILCVAAVVTSRIKIGPATLLLPLRHPTIVAKEFASLDIYSNGRVILTVGVGGEYPREFHACGAGAAPRQSRSSRSTGPGGGSATRGRSSSLRTWTCCRSPSRWAARPSGSRGGPRRP